tara:strand:- start:108 stop:254 length:147 start_codon:yes stop_codon:yes gene_type:complete
MKLIQVFAIEELSKGVDPASPLGISIISFGLVFTLGLPLLLILQGRKD